MKPQSRPLSMGRKTDCSPILQDEYFFERQVKSPLKRSLELRSLFFKGGMNVHRK